MQKRTNIFEAATHNNSRSELRLDYGKVFGTNLRLGNLGVSGIDKDYLYFIFWCLLTN